MATSCRQDAMEVDDKCTPVDAFKELTKLKLSCNLRVFGSQLGLDTSFLDDIESIRDFNERLLRILHKSNNWEQLTWTKLVNTLRQPCLNEFRVASRLLDPERDSVSSIRSRSTSLGESLSMEDKGEFLNTSCMSCVRRV